jgi:phenylpyruvate tautomerase PptA (4-oxalocrotonate tautomerase family)
MPFVEIKAFEHRFVDDEVAKRLILAVTDAVADVLGEETRTKTSVVVEGINPARWGFGGTFRT